MPEGPPPGLRAEGRPFASAALVGALGLATLCSCLTPVPGSPTVGVAKAPGARRAPSALPTGSAQSVASPAATPRLPSTRATGTSSLPEATPRPGGPPTPGGVAGATPHPDLPCEGVGSIGQLSRGFAAHGAYNGQLLPPGFDKLETEEAVTRELTKLAALPGASCLKTVYGGAMKVFEGMACRKAIGPVKGTGFGGEGMGPYKDRAYPLFADKRPASELEITRSLAPLMADPLRRACLEENYPSLGEAYDQAVDPARSPMPPPTPQPNLTPLPDAEGWIGSATPQEVEEALASAYTRKGRRWTYTIVTVADGVEESLEYVEEVLETSVELATVRSTTTKAGQRPEIKERSDPYRLVATPGEAAIVRERLEVAGGTFLTVTWTSSLPDGRVEHTWVAKGVGVVKTRREVPSTGAAITIELESFEP